MLRGVQCLLPTTIAGSGTDSAFVALTTRMTVTVGEPPDTASHPSMVSSGATGKRAGTG
jgi:hypothetical protein